MDELDVAETVEQFYAFSQALSGVVYYDTETKRLWCSYTAGRAYTYFDVSPATFTRFQSAASKGTFVNEVIKPFHAYVSGYYGLPRVTTPEPPAQRSSFLSNVERLAFAIQQRPDLL